MLARATFPNIVYVLFRRKRAILFTFLSVLILASAYCLFATAYYQAESDLYVNFSRETSSPVNSTSGIGQAEEALDQQNILNSLTQMLSSGSLVDEVISQIGLSKLYPRIASSPPWSGTAMGAAERRMLKRDLRVQVAKNANIIEVIYNHPDAQLAADTANLLVSKFIARELKLLRDPQSNFLQSQLEDYHRQLVGSEAALDEFRGRTGISSLDEERTLLLKRRTELESSLATNQAQATELESRKQVLKSALSKLPLNIDFAEEDNQSRSQLVQLQIQRQAMLNNYRQDSSSVQDIDRQIKKLNELQAGGQTRVVKQLPSVSHEEIEVDLDRNDAQLHGIQDARSTLEKQRSEVEGRLSALAGQESSLQDLERQNQIADLNYRTYFQYFEQARIGEGLNKQRISTISVIEPAGASDRPATPRYGVILTLSVGAGTVLALLVAFFLETIDERLTLPSHVEDALKLPVLTSLPRLVNAGGN